MSDLIGYNFGLFCLGNLKTIHQHIDNQEADFQR